MTGTSAQIHHPEALTRHAVVEALRKGEMMPAELIKPLLDEKHLPGAAVRVSNLVFDFTRSGRVFF